MVVYYGNENQSVLSSNNSYPSVDISVYHSHTVWYFNPCQFFPKWVFENVAKAGPIHPNQWKNDSELFLRISVKLAMLGSPNQQWGCFRGCLISINTLSFNKSAAEPHEISFPLPYCRIVYVYYGF